MVIDVWDVDTFDDELRAYLAEHAELVRSFWSESRRLFDEREKQTVRGPHEQNVFGPAYSVLHADVTIMMAERTIRAWHFTRLTKAEMDDIQSQGMKPMSLDLIRRRLNGMVAAGELTPGIADALFDASPFHRQISGNRDEKIWLTSQPFELDDDMVTGLVTGWGGESINFNHLDGRMAELLATIGHPRVIEVALPLRITTRINSAAKDVVDAFSFSLDCEGAWGGGSDIVAVHPIQPEWILAIHSPGDSSFEIFGRGYPARWHFNRK